MYKYSQILVRMNFYFENSLGRYRDTLFNEMDSNQMIDNRNVYHYGDTITEEEYKLIGLFHQHSYNTEYLLKERECCVRMVKEMKQLQPNNISFNDHELLQRAVYFGELNVAKWILSIHPDIELKMFDNLLFYNICQKGHYKMLIWLFETYSISWTKDELQKMFYESAQHYHLELASWILKQNTGLNTYISMKDVIRVIEEESVGRYDVREQSSFVQHKVYILERDLVSNPQLCSVRFDNCQNIIGFYVL